MAGHLKSLVLNIQLFIISGLVLPSSSSFLSFPFPQVSHFKIKEWFFAHNSFLAYTLIRKNVPCEPSLLLSKNNKTLYPSP